MGADRTNQRSSLWLPWLQVWLQTGRTEQLSKYTEDNVSQVSNCLGKKELQIWDSGQLEETGFGLELEVSV